MSDTKGRVYTRQSAIEANCKDCNYDSKDTGSWRAQVEACTLDLCPFYSFRPITSAGKAKLPKKFRSEKQLANDMSFGDMAKSRFKETQCKQ